jgi:hypothetical protein
VEGCESGGGGDVVRGLFAGALVQAMSILIARRCLNAWGGGLMMPMRVK